MSHKSTRLLPEVTPGEATFHAHPVVDAETRRRSFVQYVSTVHIDWKVQAQASWSVRVGEVVLVRPTANTVESIRSQTCWDDASSSWRPALVIGLQIIFDDQFRKHCSIRVVWLTAAAHVDPKTVPYASSLNAAFHKKFQIPHLLVATTEQASIRPHRLLPARVYLMTKDQFEDFRTQGYPRALHNQRHDEHSIMMRQFYYFFHTKVIQPNNQSLRGGLRGEEWNWLGHPWEDGVHLQEQQQQNNNIGRTVPDPLVQAWKQWMASSLSNDDEHVVLLEKMKESYLTSLRDAVDALKDAICTRQAEELKRQQEEAAARQAEKENRKKTLQAGTKRARSSKGTVGPKKKKKVRIVDVVKKDKEAVTSKTLRLASAKDTQGGTKKTQKRKRQPTTDIPETNQKLRAPVAATRTTCDEESVNDSSSLASSVQPTSVEGVLFRHAHKDYFTCLRLPLDIGILDAKLRSAVSQRDACWTIHVGDVVAVCHDANPMEDTFPYIRPWSVAQVLALYKTPNDRWEAKIRWFERFEELKASQQHNLVKVMSKKARKALSKETFDQDHIVFETTLMDTVSLSTFLPGNFVLTSSATDPYKRAWRPFADSQTGLPVVCLSCSIARTGKSQFRRIEDWDPADHHHQMVLSAPLRRALAKSKDGEMYQRYWPKEPLVVKPGSIVWSSGLFCFFDSLEVAVDRTMLEQSYVLPMHQADTFVVRVGDIVAVAENEYGEGEIMSKEQPFLCRWSPAQVVAIFQNGDNNNNNKTAQIQIRWFARNRDLTQHQKSALVGCSGGSHRVFETEHYDEVSVQRLLPGRVVVTSLEPTSDDSNGDQNLWKPAKHSFDGIPWIPFLCRHILVDDQIHDVDDWVDYVTRIQSLPQPLLRGLQSKPINRPHKAWVSMLSKIYSADIQGRSGLNKDLELLQQWSGPTWTRKSSQYSFDESVVTVSVGTPLIVCKHDGCDVQFFENFSVSTTPNMLVSKPRELKAPGTHFWSVNVGDVICFVDEQADFPNLNAAAGGSALWHPFTAPWSFGQVVCIFQGQSENGVRDVRVEVRKLHRNQKVDLALRRWLPSSNNVDQFEAFESRDCCEISARRVIGGAKLLLGDHDSVCNWTQEYPTFLPRIECRCRFFLEEGKVQPLYCSSFSPQEWFRKFVSRGIFRISNTVSKSGPLRQATQNLLVAKLDCLDDKLMMAVSTPGRDTPMRSPAGFSSAEMTKSEAGISSVKSILVEPKWQCFSLSSVCFEDRGAKQQWRVSEGDIIAFVADGDDSSCECFPFKHKWNAGLVKAIKVGESRRDSQESISFSVAVLDFDSGRSAEWCLPILNTEPQGETKIVACSELLGPITVLHSKSVAESVWTSVPRHLPLCLCIGKSKIASLDPHSESISEGHRAWVETPPFHTDGSTRRAFYKDMSLTCRFDKYEYGRNANDISTWNVSVGDLCAVESLDDPKRYPLNVGWAAAQVVAIWKEFRTTKALAKEGRLFEVDRSTAAEAINVEVRWFWRPSQVPGVAKSFSNQVDDFDEVLETDHVETITAARILCPISLNSDRTVNTSNAATTGLPCPSLYCARFWSVRRRSLIPCDGLKGIVKRAFIYSKVVSASLCNEKLYARKEIPNHPEPTHPDAAAGDWRTCFKAASKKLTLKDVSFAVYERGQGLVGRENELEHLSSFLESAIRGKEAQDDGGVKRSIFLAGPPGVGKTACVRAVIQRLRSDQEKGSLPSFEFVALNGIEMREPHEVYIKLWEALGGGDARSWEDARRQIEKMYTTSSPKESGKAKPVLVVLLDEIDYLVTKSQSVLYDLFNWPMLADGTKNRRKLVIIGISNTMTLAEQLSLRVRSRLLSERCLFQSYGVEETSNILAAKLKEASPNYNVFQPDAITFAARKTVAANGDIRRAFQLCRLALQLVQRDAETNNLDNPVVRIQDVQKASNQSFNTALIKSISFCREYEALCLVSIMALSRVTGRQVGGFDVEELMVKMEAMANASGDPRYYPVPTFEQTLTLLTRLAERSLMTVETPKVSFRASKCGSGGAWPLASPTVSEPDVLKGLRGTVHQKLAEQNLSRQ